jgi:hypothetical protein
MREYCCDGCHRFVPYTELEGGSKEKRRLEEGDRGGHGPKTGRSAIEEEKEKEDTEQFRAKRNR